jgi:hypothetical protein
MWTKFLDAIQAETVAGCPRCAMGHSVIVSADAVIDHGIDEVGEGVYAPPEPCPASPAWGVLLRMYPEQFRGIADEFAKDAYEATQAELSK